MTTREAKRAIRLREWNQMVKHCQESGLTVNEWCRQNNLKPTCYYYRLEQIRKGILEQNKLLPGTAQESLMPRLVKVDVAPAEEQQGVIQGVPSERFFRLQYKSAILDIPVGAGSEDIAEVLKAMGQYAL